MNDHSSNTDIMLRQMTPRELERTRLSIFRSLIAAERRRDLLKIETLALQLSAMARYIRRRAEDGQALVEACFVLPILVMILVVSVDLGCLLISRQVLQAATFSAALYGAAPVAAGDPRPTLGEVQAEAEARAVGLVLADAPTATATATGYQKGDLLTVSASAPMRYILFPNGTVSATAAVRYQ